MVPLNHLVKGLGCLVFSFVGVFILMSVLLEPVTTIGPEACVCTYVCTCVCMCWWLKCPLHPVQSSPRVGSGARHDLPQRQHLCRRNHSPAPTPQAGLQRLLRGAPGTPVCREEPEGSPPAAGPARNPRTSTQGRCHGPVRHSGLVPATKEEKYWVLQTTEFQVLNQTSLKCVCCVSVQV